MMKNTFRSFSARLFACLAFSLAAISGQAQAQAGIVQKMLQQPQAGAVPRTLADRSHDWVSVKDFGAKCDGVTNDSAAFQAAIDAYVNIYVPPGTCIIDTPLHVTTDLTIKGDKKKSILKKTTQTAENITRTYVDTTGTTQTLTWNLPVVFDLVSPNNDYLVDFVIDGIQFNLPSDASVGVFNAQRLGHSSFRNIYVNTSAFFMKGYDLWMVEFSDIRSRYSKDHFDINTGTSNTFTNVHLDAKYSGGGTGFTFTNLKYTSMTAADADAVDRAYYFDNSDVSMSGCGAESFSRILQIVDGSTVSISGGTFGIYESTSATGTFYPYVFDGATTNVSINGAWLGIKAVVTGGGTYASLDVQNGANVSMSSVRYPVEIGQPGKWYYVVGSGSVLSLRDQNGTSYINASNGVSLLDGINNVKSFAYTKSGVPAAAYTSVFRIDNSAYGASAMGRIRVYFFNPYGADAGFVGYHEYAFSAAKETTISQGITKIVGSEQTFNNSGNAATYTSPTVQLVRNADNTVDFQVYTPANYGTTTVTVVVEYMSLTGTGHNAGVMTGL